VIASRSHPHAQRQAVNTACPPRRACTRPAPRGGGGGAPPPPPPRRRAQAYTRNHEPTIAFGAVWPTPAKSIAGVDNTGGFTAIADT